jgi:hypothetical protein
MGVSDLVQQLGGVVEGGVTTVYHRTDHRCAEAAVAEGLLRAGVTGTRYSSKIPGRPAEVWFYWTADAEAETWAASQYGPARIAVTVNVSDLMCGKPWPVAPDETKLVELYVEAGSDERYRPINITLG